MPHANNTSVSGETECFVPGLFRVVMWINKWGNLCVKRERTSWILLSTRLYEYWVPVLMMVVRIVYCTSCSVCAGYDAYVLWVVWFVLWTWIWVRMCDVLHGMRSMI